MPVYGGYNEDFRFKIGEYPQNDGFPRNFELKLPRTLKIHADTTGAPLRIHAGNHGKQFLI
jgi:hypothetical protein